MNKALVSTLAPLLLFASSATGTSGSARVADLVMPATEHPGLRAVEIVLAIDDVEHPPAAAPGGVVRALTAVGVVSAVNATYAWGKPDSLLLIDASVLRFSTAEAAKRHVLGNLDGVEQIDGIGDAAARYAGRSLSFSVGAIKVVLTTISDDVDVTSVAQTYAAWLEHR